MKIDSFWPTRLVFGAGRFAEAGRLAAGLGRTALVVTARTSMSRLGYTGRLCDDLAAQGISASVFHDLHVSPTTDDVDRGAEQARRSGGDLVIGLGGGSALDCAKAIAAVAVAEIACADYLHGSAVVERALPILAIPTTSGTGSETNRSAIITDHQRCHKDGIRSDRLFPAVAVVDPELTYTLPHATTALTGFDAMAHAIESYVSPKAQPVADRLALDAVEAVVRCLPVALERPDDADARERLAWASTTMGYNLSCVGTCLPHRLDKPIGALHPEIAHAQAVAAFYPIWAEYSWPGRPERFARLAQIFATEDSHRPVAAQAEGLARRLEAFLSRIGIQQRLSDLGVKSEETPLLVERVAGDLRINPVPVERHQLADIFLRAIH